MANTRVRTLTFLPEIFQTPSNSQFLAATLDQLVNPPTATKIQGYVGSRFGYGVNANDYYVTEPTKTRADYQLDPGIIFTAPADSTNPPAGSAVEFISYPGIIDALKTDGGATDNNSALFNSQFYSWDSFADLDKLINFNEYYWLPLGPPAVTVAASTIYTNEQYVITDLPNGYEVSIQNQVGSSINPTLTLIRGGTYTFTVNQASQFWIQTLPGTSGYEPPPNQNIYTRNVFGVTNNGAEQGTVTFNVPAADAQNEYIIPDNLTVDLVSTTPFESINGQLLSSFENIDGVTSLEGLTVMFYGTGIDPGNPTGYVSSYFSEDGVPYDTNSTLIQSVTPLTLTVGSSSATNFTLSTGDTNMFTVGSLITFDAPTFGGINAGQFYYISSILNSVDFTISATPGGSDLALIPGAGAMPINFDNVPRSEQTLIIGSIANISGTDYLVLSSGNTNNMVVNTTVTFNNVFGGVTAGQVYYINEIKDSVTFSISSVVDSTPLNLTVGTCNMGVVINQGQLEDGFTTTIRDNFYRVQYSGDPSNPVVRLYPAGAIPINERITPQLGQQYRSISFYRDALGDLQEIPAITAPLDTLYYQDGTYADKVGIIKLIDNSASNGIDVDAQILGRKNYTSPNGVKFTNGLKVQFNGNVIPSSYLTGQYYVQGVGTAIELVAISELVCPENFTQGNYVPYDSTPFDTTNWDAELYIPVLPDYLTIARNSISRNPWSRSNRWFHVDVINATAVYNNNPAILTAYATAKNKAARPIIEFYPNLKLFNTGIAGKSPVDFVDTRTVSPLVDVAGALNYYPDIQVYTNATATLSAALSATTTTITVPATSVTGNIQNLMFISDSLGELPSNSQITGITGTDTLTITVTWASPATFAGGSDISFVASANTVNDYALFSGSRVIFAAAGEVFTASEFTVGQEYTIVTLGDTNWNAIGVIGVPTVGTKFIATSVGTGTGTASVPDPNVRNKIYVSEFSTIVPDTRPVLTLTVAEDGVCVPETQTVAVRGYNYQGVSFWYDGIKWIESQQKITVNQAPLFDIFDSNGISLSDMAVYPSSSFVGSKLFAYGIGSGSPDPVLGFPVRYSSIANSGDISFDVSLNSDTFKYVSGSSPITEHINIGYVYNYTSGTDYVRQLGWQTAVAPSEQYQIFSFNYDPIHPTYNLLCDIAATPEPTGTTVAGGFVTGGTYTITFSGTTDFTSFGAAANIVGEKFVANLKNPISVTSMLSGYEYTIVSLGATNWNAIGFTGTPVVGGTFIYNGTAVIGSGTVSGATAGTGIANSVGWPTVQVYVNNVYQDPATYTVTIGSTTTNISLSTNITKHILTNTVIQVLVISNQVSTVAYYSIPINLNNNPLNEDLSVANYGDISNQYRDIFINAPGTTGNIYGANNFRDLGNLVPYGTKLIQNSASLVLPGAFLRSLSTNLFDALLYNSRSYIDYKQLIVDTVQNTDFVQRYTPSQILDSALDQITASMSEINSFFWSDMLPSKNTYVSNTYTLNNGLDVSIYPLTQIYNFSSANYNGVLVYLYRIVDGVTVEKQLTTGVDYIISTTTPSLSIVVPLQDQDLITIKEYNQTYGSYVPNTPTKLGLYPSFQPGVVLDTDYLVPTYFIRGHDGSFTKLYGDYNAELGVLVDFRDQALLEFELRVYNNLKLSTIVPVSKFDIVPGFFRNTDYTWSEFLNIYSPAFLNWIGQNRLNYKTQYYTKNYEFGYNYTNSSNKLNGAPIQQGYWRGVYEYFYDTTTPNETPWEMLGFTDQPTWWEARYGPSPYTSDNGVLWGDLEAGYVWNNGNSYIRPQCARPGLNRIIPVDSTGKLLSPLNSIVGNYNPNTFQKDWVVGDDGPTELSYRRSSTYPFDLMRIFALTKPAEFYNLGVWLDNYKYNAEFDQYLVDDRNHLTLDKIPVYGSGTPVTSYINWIVDYQKQQGIDATKTITNLLNNLDVRLVYRLAGYSDKDQLQFFVEKPSPTNVNSSLLIPNESYSVLLYENQPFDRIMFSGVVVQQNDGYWTVFGNSQDLAYFEILDPKYSGHTETITIVKQKVKVTTSYYKTKTLIPYGTKFYNTQDLSQFLLAYGANLESKGMIFNNTQNGMVIDWKQMVYEFLYWTQTGWTNGSLITLNPAATDMSIDPATALVQPLTVQEHNFILNQNLYPINLKDLCINRDGTAFNVHTLNNGDAMAYAQFNISNFEHGIVFNNTTLFNDVIYNLVTGLRQNRISVRGTKSAEWNGTVNALGFIFNQNNIQQWNGNLKYTKGEIVIYKNKYWASQKVIEPAMTFDQLAWQEIAYDTAKQGLLANPSTRAYESTLYYDIYKANLQQDADLLAFSLIGYRPRDYLALIDLTSVAQVQVYQNMIINKGTLNAISAFNNANLPQGGIKYETFQNWSIKTGDYGGVLNQNFIDLRTDQKYMTGDPSIISLTDGTGPSTPGSLQVVPTYSLFNYGRQITNENILNTTSSEPTSFLFPSAGYVNFNDIKMSSYFYSGLPTAVNRTGTIIPIQNFYVGEYLWLANFKEKWGVYRWKTIGEVTAVQNNLNQTATITFSQPHGLKALDPMAIVNFSTQVDGYYLVVQPVNLYQVIISISLPTPSLIIQGRGLGMSFESHRVATPSELINYDLTENEFIANTFWVDENNDSSWAVYRKTINYLYQNALEKLESTTLGTAVAYTPDIGYMISDAGQGKVYTYSYNALTESYVPGQSFTQGVSFGSDIVYAGNTYVITQPDNTASVYIYVLNNTSVTYNALILVQTIVPTGADKVAISGDGNWIYVSDVTNNLVHVYRKGNITLNAGYFTPGQTYVITSVGDTDFTAIGAASNQLGITFVATGIGAGTGTATQITYELANTIVGSDVGIVSGDKFGFSLSTNYNGDTLVVGAPFKDYSPTINNWGTAYTYQRTLQNFIANYTSVTGTPQQFTLAWTTNQITRSITGVSSNFIAVSSATGLNVNDPVIFSGGTLGVSGIQPLTVYYICEIDSDNFTIKTSRSTNTPINLVDCTGLTCNVYDQTTPLYVSRNGVLISDNNYAVIGTQFYYTGPLLAGDIISVNDSQFTLSQELTSIYTNRTDVEFGYATDMNTFGTNILVGSPYEIDTNGEEGAVYSYINGGARYGMVIGTAECNVTGSKTVLINGYAVNLNPGDAANVANVINHSNIINVQAAATDDNKLIIQLINTTIAPVNNKLVISAFDDTVLSELGITLYTETQIIKCPHGTGPTEFGSTIKISGNSVVISAPVGTRYEGTVFDFVDQFNLDNDTVFDNNATQFVDAYPNAGAVYMFDYLANYNENISDPGAYVYAQSVNDKSLDYGYEPKYGTALDFNDNVVVIGTPNFMPTTQGGQVVTYVNGVGVPDWAVYRNSAPVVDINLIQNTQLYSATTNNTLVNLDYMDPLQGKLLGAARENLDFITGTDPAKYNVDASGQSGMLWGAEHVGRLWLDTTNIRFVNYHQNDDAVYNSQYWGATFPGSDVAVYSWIASFVPPVNYQGPGVPYDVNTYSVNNTLNASNIISPVYYFWVRNTNIIFSQTNKTLSDSVVASYIQNPKTSGISFMAPLLPNTFALYNALSYFDNTDTVFHIGFANGTTDDAYHQEFALIRENYPDDFLPGLPKISHNNVYNQYGTPASLYARMLDSLSGCDAAGEIVPDPALPLAVQSGVQSRPKQSFFYDRFLALKNYLTYANTKLAQYPIFELREELSFLFRIGPVNPSNGLPYYDTTQYWSYIDWWAPGYGNSTRATIQVAFYADLSALNPPVNTLAKVLQNGAGKWEIYRYDGNGHWIRIGLENGTIEFSSYLWDYAAGHLGWSGNFYDTTPFDLYPSEETRNIIRALNEQIYISDLLIYRNESLILLFEYIQSETSESQNFLPWLNKTSLLDVSHTVRELLPYETFRTDDEVFLEGYINETKPYHVVIKDFVFTYTGTDVYQGDITDFDVPAEWNSTYQQFISPQLVDATYPSGQYEYTLGSPIWQTQPYNQWFNNYGVSLTGSANYPISTLETYLTHGTQEIVVDNSSGFPINGVITIGTEKIGYAFVNRGINTLGGLERGVDGTPVSDHIPGERIYIDLPPVLVLNGGTGYANPPKVTAYIDTNKYPLPTKIAQFETVMYLDSVLQINLIDPGQGYVVNPEIIIEPSEVLYFTNDEIDPIKHTITVYSPNLKTGSMVQYVNNTLSDTGNLINGQWYYIGVVATSPNIIVALYSTYNNAINDYDRIPIFKTGIVAPQLMSLNLGARAFAITSSTPTRENNIKIKLDRTSYGSQVQDWVESSYYGSYFAGNYGTSNSTSISSAGYTLQNVNPNINQVDDTVFASAQGFVLEITDVGNNRQLTWSSFIRYVASTQSADNSITLIPQDGNNDPTNPEPNASGTTIGFYVGMPIKFTGATVGGLVVGVEYYVLAVIDELNFTVSETIGGSVFVLTTATVPTSGLECIVGEVVDTAILSVNYPGIMQVTATTANTNAITVPLTAIGTGGTIGFYPNLPIFFTGNVFGGITENHNYYVTSVIDDQNFTMSLTQNALTITLLATTSVTNILTVSSTDGFSVNDPIIINTMVIAGSNVSTFGNIVSGTTYYIRQILSTTEMIISAEINGLEFPLSTTDYNAGSFVIGVTYTIVTLGDTNWNAIGYIGVPAAGHSFTSTGIGSGTGVARSASAVLTDQKDTLKLTSATGSMTINVLLPVSPGQVNGQLFTMYNTSSQYVNLPAGTASNLVVQNVAATISVGDRVAMPNTDGLYINMPIRFNNPIGGLNTFPVGSFTIGNIYTIEDLGTTTQLEWNTIAGTTAITYIVGSTFTCVDIGTGLGDGTASTPTTYYVLTSGVITITVTNTSSTGNLMTCSNTDSLFVGMPIVFSGVQLGGIVIGQTYYIYSITSLTQFSISTDGITQLTLQEDNGTMTGTGNQYITISTSSGGSVEPVTDDTVIGTAVTQYVTAPAAFDISYILGGYVIIVADPGSGFAIDNTFTISGTAVGGTSPANDVTVTVTGIDTNGGIKTTSASGTPFGVDLKYYLKVYSSNQFEVYSNPLLTSPVSGIDFPYVGFTETTATATTVSTNRITVTDSTVFEVNDPVVFTGTVFGNIVLGATYYILSKPTSTTVTVSEVPNGSVFVLATDTGSMTMTKPGSFALLPEPFFFNQSIVKYNNRVWSCLISNNDPTFVFGKWEMLDSGDHRLNAMDRTIGYYQPTVNMPGVDLTQLFEGVTYPNPIYYGNQFQPSDQYTLDTLLQDKPFTDTVPARYDVQGAPFPYGYGPEELVPGVITDNLALIVNSRPGSTWDAPGYANTGYNVISIEFAGELAGQSDYSFAGISQCPAEVFVQLIDPVTGLGTTLSVNDYTVDWVMKMVTLTSATTQGVRLDVYEVGNGNQIVRSNSDTSPIRTSDVTGFNEMYLNCTYSSDTGTGLIQSGIDGEVWSKPIAYHNGTRLTFGVTNIVTQTNSSDNSIQTNSTFGMNAGDTIVFNDGIIAFNSNIDSFTTYYVNSVSLDGISFTISTTLSGPTLTLNDGSGTAYFVTNDYAFGTQPGGIEAAIIFATDAYNNTDDYLVYSGFGETTPVQYGYTIPETQTFISTGSATFTLTNYVNTQDAINAIVEVNGVRQTSSSYSIDTGTNIITFGSAPAIDAIVTVTTYNNTDQQYLNTQYGLTGNTVAGIAAINTTITVSNTTTTIQTAIANNLAENDLVSIDGVMGTTQLNGNSYYAHIIDGFTFGIYTQPYVIGGPNYAVTDVTGYVGGGFVWKQGTYSLTTTTASQSISGGNEIVVDSTADLVAGTPVYFSVPGRANGDDVLGGLIQGTEYYVSIIIDNYKFTVSSIRYGSDVVLSADTNNVNVSQWVQTNVDRLWVTIDGLRVPSSSLRLSAVNDVGILSQITSGQEVIITSMVPSATPNEETYINFVNQTSVPSVYRANSEARTWLTQDLNLGDNFMFVNDIAAITTTVVQQSVAPALNLDGYFYIGLNADKNIIASVTVFDNTTGYQIDSSQYSVVIINSAPFLKINSAPLRPIDTITEGDSLTITILEGNTVYVNGEQIVFKDVTLGDNFPRLIIEQRGANGTAILPIIPEYAEVYGLLSTNRLRNVYYDVTWNSYVYNTTKGDPLQISVTYPARFLQTDIT